MIYLDNAATTFPKPERVYRAVDRFMRTACGNSGRGSHFLSAESARHIYECREEIAEMFGGRSENVVFTMNSTYALNMAIHALYRGGEAVISGIEHNAVRRPVAALCSSYRIFEVGKNDDQTVGSFLSCLTPQTGIVVCNHVSNICGARLPIERIGKICAQRNIPFVVDASQSAGVYSIDIKKCFSSAICAPGHKGLYGLQGSGFALFSDASAEKLKCFVYGGSGMDSLSLDMPIMLPERMEAGTAPTPSVVGLKEGIRAVKSIGLSEISEKERYLSEYLSQQLMNIRGITVYGTEYRGSTVLFNVNELPSERVAEYLDTNGICVRSGFHCCPLAHKWLRTGGYGAVRASFSVFNNRHDCDMLALKLRQMDRTKL